MIEELYGYGIGEAVFKAAKEARPTPEGALSYFAGYKAVQPKGFETDTGFAINEGKGWSDVEFDNAKTGCAKGFARASGHIYLDSAAAPDHRTKVKFWFKYQEVDGALKIIAHHFRFGRGRGRGRGRH